MRSNRRRKTEGERKAQRARVFGFGRFLLTASLCLAIGLCIGYAAFRTVRFFQTSAVLRVRCIEVNGVARARPEDLLRLAELREGQNIFKVDLERVAARLEEHPWVRRAIAQRVVPDRLVLTIEEHTPAALVDLDGLYVADPAGEIFKRLQPGEPLDLPVVTSLDRTMVAEQPELARVRVGRAIALIERIEREGCLRPRMLSEVHWDELLGATVVLDPGALEVRLGPEPEKRLSGLCAVLEELERQHIPARAVLLDDTARPGRVAVQLRAPGSDEGASPSSNRG